MVTELGQRRRPWLAAFAACNAVSAWGGAVGLVTGGIDFGAATNQRLPFGSVVLAGLALAAIVALPLSVLTWVSWTGSPRTASVSLLVGMMLVGWIVLQVVVLWAYSIFQPIYLGIGASFIAASHRVELRPTRRGLLLVTVGGFVIAVGVGLLPHPIKDGLTAMSVVAIVFLLAGLAGVVEGARSATRGIGAPGKVAGGAATTIWIVAVVSIVAPGVAATNAPPAHVTSTPAAVGLEYESVTLTTTDGLDLAAWFVRGTNGAGLVVMHGAGSTRSDVLDESAALAGAGYSVLLVDARGHGDSEGTAMEFGWYGDLDIAAGTAFLASRPEVDADRIGVVGFSMGGEEAIGAAAVDPRIHAVVAEGATGRQADDKVWLSAAFGWRGRLQLRLERLQDIVTDFLAVAAAPTPLRSAVASAVGTRFLMITAGDVPDEGRAAAYVRSGAPDRVAVWTVDGAGHIGGLEARPTEWRAHVMAFLDAVLA